MDVGVFALTLKFRGRHIDLSEACMGAVMPWFVAEKGAHVGYAWMSHDIYIGCI